MSLRIDGKKISSDIKEELKEQVKLLKEEGISVCLAVIQVGSDPASSVYVNNKKKACAYVGINSRSYELPEDTSEQTLLDLVQKLNEDPEVNGILVQLPLPKQIDEDKVIRTISPDKEVRCNPAGLLLHSITIYLMERQQHQTLHICRIKCQVHQVKKQLFGRD